MTSSTIDTTGIDATKPAASASLVSADVRNNISAIKTQLGNAKTDLDTAFAGVYHIGMRSGRYYPPITSINTSGGGANNSQLSFHPIFIPSLTTFTGISTYVTTAAAGAARMGIYSNSGGLPGTLVLDAGTVDTSTTGEKTITISQALAPGWYWLAICFNAAPSVLVSGATTSVIIPQLGNTTPNQNVTGMTASFVYGVLPSSAPSVTVGTTNIPTLYLKV